MQEPHRLSRRKCFLRRVSESGLTHGGFSSSRRRCRCHRRRCSWPTANNWAVAPSSKNSYFCPRRQRGWSKHTAAETTTVVPAISYSPPAGFLLRIFFPMKARGHSGSCLVQGRTNPRASQVHSGSSLLPFLLALLALVLQWHCEKMLHVGNDHDLFSAVLDRQSSFLSRSASQHRPDLPHA